MGHKCLYTCGDSWTFGDEICEYTNVTVNDYTIRHYNTWPWFLTRELGIANCINEGLGGRSNQRIFRRTINFIFKWIESGKKPEDLLIVIGWTSPERYEIPVLNKDEETNYVGLTVGDPIYRTHLFEDGMKKRLGTFNRLFYELIDVDGTSTDNNISQMKLLRIVCEYYGIDYYDFFAIVTHPMTIKNKSTNGEFDNLFNKQFEQTLLENKWSKHKHGHPTIESHKNWAKELKSFIKNEHNIQPLWQGRKIL
jgi:hypothetical protein